MVDWSITTLNTADLSPKKRLEILYEKAKYTHVDDGVDVKRYSDIANEILNSAKKLQNENKCEDSLLNFLKYQTLVKKLKLHARYKKLHLGKRAAFDYTLKEVAKNVKNLTENVLAVYKNINIMSRFSMDNNYEGYQEQRPTISTVRTFVSSQASLGSKRLASNGLIPQTRGRSKSISTRRISSAISISIIRSSSSLNLDANYGIRKSIFPPKQVKEFDEIYKQRRTVRSHRTVVIPSRVTTAFSYLSLKNTKNNVETVAYLAGKELNSTMLIITHLLLPPQQGFSDFFKVTESTSLIKYLDINDLMTIGWIHSHPVETPFLSSSDMHYHSIFQNVLPEAIAIVYSPKEMRSVAFNLTPDYGLATISKCSQKGFHAHPTKQPLTMVSHHTITDLCADLIIKDLRNEVGNLETQCTLTGNSRHKNLLQRLLQVETSVGRVDPMKMKRSEVNFVRMPSKT